jgi:hypothetical protein
MFKRLAGVLHVITTVTTLVVVELVKSDNHVSRSINVLVP